MSKLSSRIVDRVSRLWSGDVPRERGAPEPSIRSGADNAIPVIWLVGKAQAGKSSIVRVLTGADSADIGSGYKACTRTSRLFDFPEEKPVVRFLDTRGLGEAAYAPAEDVEWAADRAHLVLVVTKATDHVQNEMLELLAGVRRAQRDIPIVVAQTTLHASYDAGMQHVEPYPYALRNSAAWAAAGAPQDLVRSLSLQRQAFAGISGPKATFAAIDFTKKSDGWSVQDYGREALTDALLHAAPHSLALSIRALAIAGDDPREKQLRLKILGYATAAAVTDLVPVAAAVAVPAVQAQMLRDLAQMFAVTWDRRMAAEFASALGTAVLVRLLAGLGIRQIGKLVPVYGQTAGAASASLASFATTYAIGRASCYYLQHRASGAVVPGDVADVFRAALSEAFNDARNRYKPY